MDEISIRDEGAILNFALTV